VEIGLKLSLPRDELTVPVARRIVDSAMSAIGVDPSCASDVTIAMTEACTNVIKHAGPADEYELEFRLDNASCEIWVRNFGEADVSGFSVSEVAHDAERGRGFQLMQALVDDLHFVSDQVEGTIVVLRKTVTYRPGGLLDVAANAAAAKA
jgi:serine/threonine-protein kinase RsbW